MKNQTTTTIFTVIIIALVGVLAFGLIGGIFGKEEEVDTPDTSRPAVTEPATEETEKATEPETEPAREITFTLMSVSCTALEGMTWGEWVDTDYNFGGYNECQLVVVSSDGEHIESNAVYGGLFIVLGGNYISPNDLIIENGVYDPEEP